MRLAPDELYGVQTALDNVVPLSVVEEPVVLVRDRFRKVANPRGL